MLPKARNRGAVNLCMTRWAERQHKLQGRPTWPTVVHHDGSLPSRGSAAPSAAIPITLEYLFAKTAEVTLILAPERVAGSAEATRNDRLAPTATVKGALRRPSH